jgi:hypothetical protein
VDDVLHVWISTDDLVRVRRLGLLFVFIFVYVFVFPFLGGCATVPPKDEPVNPVDPNLPPPDMVSANASVSPAAAPPPVLYEALTPVRGGDHALPPYGGPEPCKMALTGDSPVARACSDRGLRGAMELMQTFVKRAKAEGFTFVCTDCHAEEDDYSRLTPIADPEFRKLLFLARPE